MNLRDTYVTANGVRLHCVTAGQGPLILFLHGFPEFWYAWKDQLEEFGKDHLVVAPDLRGYNLSEKPAALDQYRPDVLVEDIRALADHFRQNQKFVLVGHDWGGALAWLFAMAHPGYMQKLIIINAPHPAIFSRLLASDPAQQQASQYMLLFRSPGAEDVLSANNYAALVDAVLGNLLKTGAFTAADKAAYLEAWSQPGALTGGLNYYRASNIGPPASPPAQAARGPSDQVPRADNSPDNKLDRLDPANGGPSDQTPHLDRLDPAQMRVHVPTLVLWGEQDIALLPSNLDGLDQFVPQLTVQRIPDGSHWLIHEHPARINAAIRSFIR